MEEEACWNGRDEPGQTDTGRLLCVGKSFLSFLATMEDDSLTFVQGKLPPHTLAFEYSLLCGLQAAIELSTSDPQSTDFSL